MDADLELAALGPRLDLAHVVRDGAGVVAAQVSLSQQPDAELGAQLVALLSHPQLRSIRRLSLCATFPTIPEVDFAWALDLIAARCPLPALERLFVGGARQVNFYGIGRMFARPGRLATDNRIARWCGEFPAIRVLDLRDEQVEWNDCHWPALEVLILRPRGNPARNLAWARTVLASAAAFPLLREVRFPENQGDALLALLLDSPVLPQLRCLDLTDNITNEGGRLLHDRASQLGHLEQILIGSTDRRRRTERMHPGVDLPRGTLEIDDGWRSRLRLVLGRHLRFKPRPDFPDL